MNKNLGYKAMLRDRLPETVDLALRWIQSKNKWIDHVYSNFIGVFVSKEDRNTTTRIILGLSNKGRKFDFHTTINWGGLTKEEKEEWENVEGWVTWFQSNMLSIDNLLDVLVKTGTNKDLIYNKLYNSSALSDVDEQWKSQLIDFILKNKT